MCAGVLQIRDGAHFLWRTCRNLKSDVSSGKRGWRCETLTPSRACQVSGGVKAEVDVLDHPGKEILDHAVPFVWER